MPFCLWVKLMRRRNVKNAQSRIDNHLDLVIKNPQDYRGKWQELFNNHNPIYLEIGMGKGKFLLEHANHNPNINYIGLEKFDSVIVQAVEKISLSRLSNIKLINEDATKILEFFDQKEIQKIYLNFSDPWPKNRHEKRRLTHKNFLKKYERILNGDLEMKTDNQTFFEYSLISFNQEQWKILDLSLVPHHRGEDDTIISTESEERYIKKGNQIYFLKTKK